MDKIKIIDKNQLEEIKGGATISVWTGIIVATVIIFLSGVIEGITNPERCNE